MFKRFLFICIGLTFSLNSQNIQLIDTPLTEKPADKVKSVELAIWVEEKELSTQQIEYIESIEKLFSELGGTVFETAEAFNLYFAAIYAGFVAIGIKKPIKFSIVLQNDDHIDIWRLNGFDLKKFFNIISPRHILEPIEEAEGY